MRSIAQLTEYIIPPCPHRAIALQSQGMIAASGDGNYSGEAGDLYWCKPIGSNSIQHNAHRDLRGKSGLRRLLRKAFDQDVDARWSFTALFLPAAAIWLPITAINALLGGPVPLIFNPPGGVLSWWELVPLIFGFFIIMAWTEEIGWRGFALPRLQANRSALSASIILGVIWGIWHLPDRMSSEDFSCPFFILFMIWIVAASILFTWLYNNTNEWTSTIPAQNAGIYVEYFFESYDNAGNRATTETHSYIPEIPLMEAVIWFIITMALIVIAIYLVKRRK